LKTLNTSTWQQVANAITAVVTHAMMLIALADFFALKYLQANAKYMVFDEKSFLRISYLNLSF
jgi:hypothetical protein